jgi:hypothetical protein
MITVGKLKQLIKGMSDETFLLVKPGDSIFKGSFLGNGTIVANERIFEFSFATDFRNGETILTVEEVTKRPI